MKNEWSDHVQPRVYLLRMHPPFTMTRLRGFCPQGSLVAVQDVIVPPGKPWKINKNPLQPMIRYHFKIFQAYCSYNQEMNNITNIRCTFTKKEKRRWAPQQNHHVVTTLIIVGMIVCGRLGCCTWQRLGCAQYVWACLGTWAEVPRIFWAPAPKYLVPIAGHVSCGKSWHNFTAGIKVQHWIIIGSIFHWHM
jgi:hypothetical protein